MSIDLEKLTPAPWRADENMMVWGDARDGEGEFVVADTGYDENAEFIALARNAFDGDPEALAWWEANRKKR